MTAGHGPRLRLAPRPGTGKLIAVDGMDGSGKTTLVERLRTHLARQGVPVVTTRLPTTALRRSRFFRLLRNQGRVDLIDPVAFEVEYMVDRIQHCRTVIEPALRNGTTVITDRYVFSSIGTLLLRLPDLKRVVLDAVLVDAWFAELCRNLTQPDLWLLLHTDAEASASRLRRRRDEADVDFPVAGYEQLSSLLLRLGRANGLVPIDSGDSAEATLAACLPYLPGLGLTAQPGELV